MQTLRRFLVLQALLLWQGGFLFYAGVVVPIGTNVLGSFDQGRVTREVTHVMNIIGVVALLIFALDQIAEHSRKRWMVWLALAVLLAGLWLIHPRIEAQINFTDSHIADYPNFYFWHRVYLYTASAEWIAGLVYAWLLVAERHNA